MVSTPDGTTLKPFFTSQDIFFQKRLLLTIYLIDIKITHSSHWCNGCCLLLYFRSCCTSKVRWFVTLCQISYTMENSTAPKWVPQLQNSCPLDQKLPIKTECLCTTQLDCAIVLPLLEYALLDQLFRFLSRFWQDCTVVAPTCPP